MRKLATTSSTEESARNESCSHEEGTAFYAIADVRYQLRDCKPSRLPKKDEECFENLSMNGIFSIISCFPPFVLSLSQEA